MKKIIISALVALFTLNAFADEGMWLLPLLERLNLKDMKAKGLELTAEDIYSVNNSSLKDAIVIFGGGCTGEIVSPNGLLFTNHHCGFGSIQALSSVEHDYLKNGFWAMNEKEELPAPGLSVTFIRHIEDVTKSVLKGVKEGMTYDDRAAKIKKNTDALRKKMEKKHEGKSISIKEFFGGNQYFILWNIASRVMPALLTRISTRPNFSVMVAKAAFTSSWLATLHLTAMTRSPVGSSSLAEAAASSKS